MRHLVASCVVALFLPQAAAAQDILVLKWPGSSVGHDDAKVQKSAAKTAKVDNPEFRNGDVLFPADKARDMRIDLIKKLTDPLKPSCQPALQPNVVEHLAAYSAEHSDFWIAVPVEGKANDVAVFKWTAETSALDWLDRSCS